MTKYRYNGKYITKEEWDELPKRTDWSNVNIQTRVHGEFRSPIDGTVISSSGQMKDHCSKHDVIQVGDEYKRKRERRDG